MKDAPNNQEPETTADMVRRPPQREQQLPLWVWIPAEQVSEQDAHEARLELCQRSA